LLKSESDFDYYDPQRIFTPEDQAFFGATIMRSLVAYHYSSDPAVANTLVPDMATDTGTANSDATMWTFTLRDGLTWQDGSPVKCEDVKYGISRTFATDVINGGPVYAIEYLDIPKADDGTSAYKGPYSAEGQDLFDQAVTCNGRTITFHLAQTVPDFNYAVSMGFGAVPNPVDHPGVDTVENYVGDAVWSDGPYQITSYTGIRHEYEQTPGKGGSLILDRNSNWNPSSDDYRGAFPDKWEVDFALDPETIDRRLIQSTGADAFAIDYPNIRPDDLRDVFADPHTVLPAFDARAFSSGNGQMSYYWINTQTVSNRDIRAAVASALDREAIRQSLGGQYAGDFADGAVNPSIGLDYAPTGMWNGLLGQPIPDGGDPNWARTLVAQSGLASPTLTWVYYPTPSTGALVVKQSLERAGFGFILKRAVCCSTVFDQHPGDIGTFFCDSWRADFPNASTVIPPLFTQEGGCDQSNVDDSSGIPDWTEQVRDAQTTLDRSAQAVKWQNLNTDASDQAWIIPLLFGLSQHIGGTNVGNLYRWAPYASWPYAQLYVKSS
jgi:peptide/nickel transport system substrate-binding protein